MAIDDSDNMGQEVDLDEERRHTDVTSPSSDLIMESRRSEHTSVPSTVSTIPGVRMSGSGPGMSSTTKKILFPTLGLIAFFLGILVSMLVQGGKISALEQEVTDVNDNLGTCTEGNRRCINELKGCVTDVSSLTKTASDPSLTPRNFLVERTRKRKDTVQGEYDVKLEQILDAAQSLKFGNKNTFKKSAATLKTDITDFKKLVKELEKASRDYKDSVITAFSGTSGMSFQEATERNSARMKYLSELESTESTEPGQPGKPSK